MTNVIDSALDNAVNEGIFPSAQLLIAKDKNILLNKAYGNAEVHTLFDIASLTKPISTTTLLMQLVAGDSIRLDDPVVQYLPEFQAGAQKNITIRHLLSHSSGLPAWQPFYQLIPHEDIGKPSGRKQIIEAVYSEPLAYEPDHQNCYSDLGFILLGEIIEKVLKEPLNLAFDKRVSIPLGLEETLFIPLNASRKLGKEKFAPTEDCPWRNRVIRGEVHDQNCYAMGGVAGHAGLFSTAGDINKFITVFVDSYNGNEEFLQKDVIKRFLPFHYKLTECNTTWLLGWDRPSHINSQAGSHFSKKSIGHLGYTGCSMWIDLEKDAWIILLTNRIHPTTTNERIKSFRPMIYNMIYEELFLALST